MRYGSIARGATSLMVVVLLLSGFGSACSPERKGLTTEQKLEDFSYLFQVLAENHPYIALKARAEGYDWLSKKSDFEQAVRASEDDGSFARAIAWMLMEFNNGHTNVMPSWLVQSMANWNEEPWKEVARQTSPERMDYWYRLATSTAQSATSATSTASATSPTGTTATGGSASKATSASGHPPFLAVYNSGQYLVVAVAPDEAVRNIVRPGMTLLGIGGIPVSEYVAAQRGKSVRRLLYDPVRKQLYQCELILPSGEEPLAVSFRDASGEVVEVQVPRATQSWSSNYVWPPRYAGQPGSPTPYLYTAVLADGTVGYVQIANFINEEEDARTLREFFEQVKDLPDLIIDIRGNGGGKTTYWLSTIVGSLAADSVWCDHYITWRSGGYAERFALAKAAALPFERIPKEALVEAASEKLSGNIPPEVLTDDFVDPLVLKMGTQPATDSIGYRGKVYLLVDDLCYSAAEGFAAFCKATGFATLVGTWTGGDGISITPALVALPNSGMVVRFPLTMGLNPDFTANEETHTLPDVMVQQGLDDILTYLARDPAVERSGPDPSFDAALRTCLALAQGKATK